MGEGVLSPREDWYEGTWPPLLDCVEVSLLESVLALGSPGLDLRVEVALKSRSSRADVCEPGMN